MKEVGRGISQTGIRAFESNAESFRGLRYSAQKTDDWGIVED
jgi:hypothetical protein